MCDDLRLLAIQAATLFELTESGRLRRVNSPDRSAAPRMWMGGSGAGNVVRLRVDVCAATARAVEGLVAREPPLNAADSLPVHLDDYAELLAPEGPVEKVILGRTYVFPDSRRREHDARVVSSDTAEGARLLARLHADGMPEGLAAIGFSDAAELWPPWCATLDQGTIASVAFTARLSPVGAEVGVATARSARGRGFAGAAAAAWSSLASLEGRVLFYSTNATNLASQRVADRLRLRFVGPSLAIQ